MSQTMQPSLNATSATTEKWTRYRDIVFYRTLAGLKSESRQNYLGYLWLLLEPGLNTAVWYVVLRLYGKADATIFFLLMGTIPWQWFESSVSMGMGAIRAKLHILNHFHLPKYLFPIVTVLTNTWKFCCVYTLILLAALIFGIGRNWWMLTLPVVVFAQVLVILGFALPLAVMNTYFNDTQTVMSSIFRIMYFLSGIFYSGADVPAHLQPYFYANPMACLIQAYRDIVINASAPDLGLVLYPMAFGLVFITIGVWWCNRVDGRILKSVNA